MRGRATHTRGGVQARRSPSPQIANSADAVADSRELFQDVSEPRSRANDIAQCIRHGSRDLPIAAMPRASLGVHTAFIPRSFRLASSHRTAYRFGFYAARSANSSPAERPALACRACSIEP